MAEPLVAVPIRYALRAATIRIDASPELTCRALLAYAAATHDVLLYSDDGGQIRPGCWRASRDDNSAVVRYELEDGPLPDVSFELYADACDAGSTLLRIEGSYVPPRALPFSRKRPHQMAEALADGLAASLQHALANMRELGFEQRAAPRRLFDVPARLRLGDQPWAANTRDISKTGIGMFVRAAPGAVAEVAARIGAHGIGAAELLVGDARLITRVEVLRARPQQDGVDVGLRFTNPTESERFVQRLVRLGLWEEAESREHE